MTTTTLDAQIVLLGVGGQGILFATRLLEACAMRRGLPIIGSETHGMSQRGGSVSAHLKIGAYEGPLIAEGAADVVFGLERNEALKGLRLARAGGTSFIALAEDDGDTAIPEAVASAARGCDISIVPVEVGKEAARLGLERSANLILLGASGAHPAGPFSLAELQGAAEALSPPPFRDANRQALDAGAALIRSDA